MQQNPEEVSQAILWYASVCQNRSDISLPTFSKAFERFEVKYPDRLLEGGTHYAWFKPTK
jgi:hypothetical protein